MLPPRLSFTFADSQAMRKAARRFPRAIYDDFDKAGKRAGFTPDAILTYARTGRASLIRASHCVKVTAVMRPILIYS